MFLAEGVREKNGMSSILKQISSMKDNCYYLNRAMWNEVNEDWPFYTETERQMLKRCARFLVIFQKLRTLHPHPI